MKYALDTDILIYFLKGKESVVSKMCELPVDELGTTIINHAELFFGALNSAHKKKNTIKVQDVLGKLNLLPFCEGSSYRFAENKATLKKTGKIVADLDLMIASICIQNEVTLITNNVKHFKRIKGLKIENWS